MEFNNNLTSDELSKVDSSFDGLDESDPEDDDLDVDFEEDLDWCVSHLEGNRILPIGKLAHIMRTKMCCHAWAIKGHKNSMNFFIEFCTAYEQQVQDEEDQTTFFSRTQRLEWRMEQHKSVKELYQLFCGSNNEASMEDNICKTFHVGEETYAFATSILERAVVHASRTCFALKPSS